jgi:hypothetical protein
MKFGKAREVKAVMQEFKKIKGMQQSGEARVLFDLVGPAYTMVLESSYASLAEFEKEIAAVFGKQEWRDWYQRLVPLIEQSYREMFTVME